MINEPASNLATKFVDAEGVTIGSSLMLRERTEISGASRFQIATVLPVDPASNDYGLTVRDPYSTVIVSRLGQTLFVQLDPGHLLGNVGISGTPTVTANAGSGSFTVQLDPGHTLGAITNTGFNVNNSPTVTANVGTGTMAVFFDQSNPSVKANAGTGSFNVQFDPGHTLGKIDAGLGTFNVQLDPGHQLGNIGTLTSVTNTVNVQLDPGHTLGSISTLGSITNTVAVFFSPANPSVNATFAAASIEVIPTTGSRKTMDDAAAAQRVLIVGSQTNASLTINGTITGITNSINAYIGATAGTLGVRIGQVDGTVAVYFSPSNPSVSATFSAASIEVIPTTGSRKITDDSHAAMRVLIAGSQTAASLTINGTLTGITNSLNVYLGATAGTLWVKPDPAGTYFTNGAHTAGIFTVSGSTSGISVSGVNLVAPSASYNFKVFAYSIQTTGIVSVVPKFVNGSGASQTEFWRPLATANQTASTPIGANMAVAPPGYIFATGTNTSLNLLLDTATLVHYSVSYIKESA